MHSEKFFLSVGWHVDEPGIWFLGQNQRDPILVGRCTTHFGTYFSGWIGMFTGVRFGF